MPREKRPRLWFRPGHTLADGYVREGAWIILDRGRHIATGCAQGEVERADRALAAYIGGKYTPDRKTRSVDQVTVAETLTLYDIDVGPGRTPQKKFDAALRRLNDLLGGNKTLGEISTTLCNDYTEKRGTKAGARRDLEILRAAINHHADEGLHREIVKLTLPAKGEARMRWLPRDEVAALLWVCWRTREAQRRHRGDDRGRTLPTEKYPLRHLAKLVLIGIYTGSRYGAIAAASPHRGIGRSWVNLDAGVFHRRPEGAERTKKRQPPVRLPDRLLAHMRRWARLDPKLQHFVEWHGQPIKSVKTGLTRAAKLAGIDHVSPHVFRHTAATWLMQAGVNLWEAAGFLGMSERVLRDVYGHHHPDFQADAAAAISGGRRRRCVA